MKKKLLLIGNTNLPIEKNTFATAGGLRSWHFLKPILQYTDYNVYCFFIDTNEKKEITIKNITTNELNLSDNEIKNFHKCNIVYVNKYNTSLKNELKKYIQFANPDVAVSINTYPSFISSMYIDKNIPLWCDLNGWIMAECVAQASVIKSNTYIPIYYNWEKTIIKRADKFSVVSLPQKYALIGELSTFGRLNYLTDEYDFVSVIQNANEVENTNVKFDENIIKKYLYLKDKKIILQNGRYNSWVDVDTLFFGLEKVISQDQNIFFISTMTDIPGYDIHTFQKMKKLTDKSKYKKNFILLNNIPQDELYYLYSIATIGINIDKKNYESIFGARNRLNELMINKVPIITTLNSEISYDIFKNDIGIVVEPNNPNLLADTILKYIYNKQILQEYANNAYKFCVINYNYTNTTKDLINWLKKPTKAPDWNINFLPHKINYIKNITTTLKTFGIKDLIKKLKRKIIN